MRPEYEMLARDFSSLARQFGIAVDARLERDLLTLMAAFEAIDRHVDALPDAASRATLAGAIVSCVRGGGAIDGELGVRIAALRSLLAPIAATGFVADSLARFFAHSEQLRATTDARDYLRAVLDEAARASEMTLAVAARAVDQDFARFFAVLSEVANLVDKLHDVRGDRRRGEIAVAAGARLHALLLYAFLRRCARLLALAPRPLALIAWGARYLIPPASASAPLHRSA
jgi:hypothetical protein